MGVTISFDKLWKRFGDVIALRDVAYEIKENEFFVLLGPSGAGKTTTLKLIAGLTRPSAGSVSFDGEDVSVVPPQQRRARMAFENYSLYPHMTVFENLASPLRAQEDPVEDIEGRVRSIAEMLEIDPLLKRLPRELSGGQKQRVSLGRALVVDSNVFLLDEPLAHLDAKIRNQLRAKFQDIKSFLNYGTVVYVTHDYQEALALADRIGVLVDGQIQQIGAPKDVYDRPSNVGVAQLLGQPEINIETAELTRDGGAAFLQLQEARAKIPVPQSVAGRIASVGTSTFKIGIRPQFWEFSTAKPTSPEEYFETRVEVFEIRNYKGVVKAGDNGFSTYILCDSDDPIEENAPIWLKPNWERVILFDAASGQRVAIPEQV